MSQSTQKLNTVEKENDLGNIDLNEKSTGSVFVNIETDLKHVTLNVKSTESVFRLGLWNPKNFNNIVVNDKRSLTEIQKEEVLLMLTKSIDSILNNESVDLDFQQLYNHVYVLVLNKCGASLYKQLINAIKSHLVDKVYEDILNSTNENFLDIINEEWNQHVKSMETIRNVFIYLDKIYAQEHHSSVNLYIKGLNLFKNKIIIQNPIQNKLKEKLLHEIDENRNGKTLNRIKMKNLLQMLVRIGINSKKIYQDFFEKTFIRKSIEFYREESKKIVKTDVPAMYAKKMRDFVTNEIETAKFCMDHATGVKIERLIRGELIGAHMKIAPEASTGLSELLKSQQIEDLAFVYSFFIRTKDGRNVITEYFNQYILDEGTALLKNKQSDCAQSLSKFKDSLKQIVERSFNNDHKLNDAVDVWVNYFSLEFKL